MGSPAILSALQSLLICILNRKNGKLTFSNGPQLMEKSLWQIVMHHWTVHAKVEFQNIFMLGQGGSFHNFDPKLRNERFTLISCNIKCITVTSNLHFE